MCAVTHFYETGSGGPDDSGVVIPPHLSVVSAPVEGEMTMDELITTDQIAAKAMAYFYGCNITREGVRTLMSLNSDDDVLALFKRAKTALSQDAMMALQEQRRNNPHA